MAIPLEHRLSCLPLAWGVLCFGGQKRDEHSVLGGVVDVMVNLLEPGEDQTVSVMMQAPSYVRNINPTVQGYPICVVDGELAQLPSLSATYHRSRARFALHSTHPVLGTRRRIA